MFDILTPDLFNLVVVILLVVITFSITRYFNAVRYTEGARRLISAWGLIDDAVYDLIIFIADDQADLENEALIYDANEAGIDVRMYWLVQQVEKLAAGYLGFTPDFVQLQRRAERILSELQADPEEHRII